MLLKSQNNDATCIYLIFIKEMLVSFLKKKTKYKRTIN